MCIRDRLVLFASTLYLDIVHPIANPFQ